MDVLKHGTFFATVLIFVGCTAEVAQERQQSRGDSATASSSDKVKDTSTKELISQPEDSFEVTLPTGANWQVCQRGPLGMRSDTFVVAVADLARNFQLTVLVLPESKDAPTLDAMKVDWETGFLEKATRKLSSEDITIDGRRAYKVVASTDVADGRTFEIVGILVVAEGRNFTLGITKPGKDVLNDPEVRKFVDSFRIVDNGT